MNIQHVALIGVSCLLIEAVNHPANSQTLPQLPDLRLPQDPLLPDNRIPELETKPNLDVGPLPELNQPETILPRPITVTRFEFTGNTVFSDKELEAATATFLDQTLTSVDLLKVRQAITDMYVEAGYTTSAAVILLSDNPSFDPEGATLVIRIVEGYVEAIKIQGTQRLQSYIRNRLQSGTSPILNQNRLLESLIFLQSDPLIDSISADIAPGSTPDQFVINVKVIPANTISLYTVLDNNRSPSVGSFQRSVEFQKANLLGFGDTLSLTYRNTDGSNALQAGYRIPFNAKNGTIAFDYTYVDSTIIEEPFDVLDISAVSQTYRLTVRQPLLRRATENSLQEFSVGLSAIRDESQSFVLGIPFPVFRGSDEEGKTRTTVFSFFQEWSQENDRQVLIVRSEFNFGLDIGATENPPPLPDGQFFLWRSQLLWGYRLPNNWLLVTRMGLQFADQPLLPTQQFSLGGVFSIRSYQQDLQLTDNGFLGSIEVRIPIYSGSAGQFLLIPFFDAGTGWNNSEELFNRAGPLASVGLGLQYNFDNRISARLNWGYPLIDVPGQEDFLDVERFNLSLNWRAF